MTPPPVPAAPTLLVVDDTPANLSLLLDALSGNGYRVLVAEGGEEALATMGHVVPDLILLDACMPGLDGFAVCARLKQEPAWRDIPVLFATAVDETEQKVRAFAVGAYDYLTKPLQPAEVLARIRTQLELRALRRSLQEKTEALEREVALRLDAEAQLERSLEVAVLVWREERLLFATNLARSLLDRYASKGEDRESVARRLGRGEEVAGLTLRRVKSADPRGVAVGVLEELQQRPGPAKLMVLGLSPRQAEVLFWMAEGKTNGEIAVILEASPRTIEKHAEMIFQRLGVSTRTAAMLQAIERLRLP